jgi:GNAT superfamily N-acetyltransferase
MTRVARAFLHGVWHAYREGGARLVARKAASKLSCEVVLYAFELDRDVPAVASELALEVRVLSPDDVDSYVAFRRDEDAGAIQARLRRGDLGFASWSEERMVGDVWVRFDRMWVSELGRSFPLHAGDAYGYASFIDPEHRRRGAAGVLYEAAMRHVEGLGYRRMVVYVLRENVPGRAALHKLRFVPIGRVRWFHVGRYGLELSARDGTRPGLRVHVRSRDARE